MTFDRMVDVLGREKSKKVHGRKARPVRRDARYGLEQLEARLLLSADLGAIAAEQHMAATAPSPDQAASVQLLPEAPTVQTAGEITDSSFPSGATAFGQAVGSRDVVLGDAAGQSVRFTLDGNGTGEAVQTDGQWQVRLTGTDSRSYLTIESESGAPVSLLGLEADQSVGRINAAGAELTGTLTVNGPVRSLVLGAVDGGTIRASQIELLTVLNDMDHALVQLGHDGTSGPIRDYRLGVLWVGGSLTSSHIELAETGGPRTLGLMSVQGSISADSTVTAKGLPPSVLSGGTTVPTAGDARFTGTIAPPAAEPDVAPSIQQTDPLPVTPSTDEATTPPTTVATTAPATTAEETAPPPTEPDAQPAVGASLVTQPLQAAPAPSAPATSSPAWEATVRQWEQNMVNHGRKMGEQLRSVMGWQEQVNATYYDGARVFAQIADYTGDSSWYGYVETALQYYRDGYVLPRDGAVQGYWNFTEGLQMHHQRTGNPADLEAVRELATNASYTPDITPLEWSASADTSREVAYAIMSYVNAEAMGLGHRQRLGDLVNQAIDHIDQWFVSQSAQYVRPFMVGLTMQALIEVYHVTSDPRIPAAIKTALDGLWDRTWVSSAKAFMYTDRQAADGSGGTGPTADLNLLIAPAYAWMYKLTGDATYRDRGDQVFTGGVEHSHLGSFKHFNQNYMWSFDYLKWRGRA